MIFYPLVAARAVDRVSSPGQYLVVIFRQCRIKHIDQCRPPHNSFSRSPIKELSLAGYRLFEALWADEVFQLMETEPVDVVVIKTGIDGSEIPDLQKKMMSLVVDSSATLRT